MAGEREGKGSSWRKSEPKGCKDKKVKEIEKGNIGKLLLCCKGACKASSSAFRMKSCLCFFASRLNGKKEGRKRVPE